MACYLCSFSFLLIIATSSHTITKSITLSPSDHTKEGVQVVLDPHNSNVVITPNQWNINVSNTNGWDLHISMNNSWKFLPNQASIITLKAYSESTKNSPHNILFTYSQNKAKYISSNIAINGNSYDIYPHNEKHVLMANGDINLLLNDNNNTKNREHKLTHGLPQTSITTDTPNEFPVIIQLFNDPINELSEWKYKNEECQFEPFSTDYPIDIYISAADFGQILSINKFEISFTYNQTDLSVTNDINSDSNEENGSDIQTFVESHHKLIVFILIGITIFLFVVCNILMIMLINLSIDNRRMQTANPLSNGNTANNIERELTISSQMSEVNTDMVDFI